MTLRVIRWSMGNGDRIAVEGVPRTQLRIETAGDHAVGETILTATELVDTVAAPARHPTALDLPLITGAGLMG